MSASHRVTLRLGLVFGLLAVVACTARPRPSWIERVTRVDRPVVDRLENQDLRIRWPLTFAVAGAAVYRGSSPASIDHSHPVARILPFARSVVISGLDPFRRYYFELVPNSDGRSIVVAERRLPLEGADNFRDLGGYETEDGRIVEWGLLYRSNALADLTDADLRYLQALQVKMVCDFRSPAEAERDPDRTPTAPSPAIARLPIEVLGVDPLEMQRSIQSGRISPRTLERTMESAYRGFVTDFSGLYASMFERILNPEQVPTILHCTAGKDRAGFAAALVLLALGVPEQTVFEDYLLTNAYRGAYNDWIARLVPFYSIFRTSREDVLPLLEARRSYLGASLDEIKAGYGSVDAYLEQGLGLTRTEREQMRAMFLRDADGARGRKVAIEQGSRRSEADWAP